MDLQISAKNVTLNNETEDYIEKKFDRLERHLNSMGDVRVEVSQTSARSQTDRFVAQITINAGGTTLRGQESGLSLFAAIDAVTDVMDKQIRRYKGRAYRTSQARRSARDEAAREDASIIAELPDDEAEDAIVDEFGHVVRTKRFPMKPMTAEEAIMEMELLDHDFFLFNNTETDEYNVVYRRRDGDYGIIEPELS